jgi:hypothetical protein
MPDTRPAEGAALRPSDCPKFETCGASVCPLDPGWRSAVHLRGERVCQYLLATGKAGAAERFAGDPVFRVVLPMVNAVAARFPDIGHKAAAAARSGFRQDNLAPRKPPPEATSGALYGKSDAAEALRAA